MTSSTALKPHTESFGDASTALLTFNLTDETILHECIYLSTIKLVALLNCVSLKFKVFIVG